MAKTRLLELAMEMTDRLRVRKKQQRMKNKSLASKAAVLKKKLEEKKRS